MKNRFELNGPISGRYFIFDHETKEDLKSDAERLIEFKYKCDAKAVAVLLNDYENQIRKIRYLVESI